MATASNAAADAAQGPVYAKAEAADAFGRRLLVAHGLSEEDAATMAGCLVRADLRGVDTHGLQFLPQYASSGAVAVSMLLLCGLGGLLVIWKAAR